VVVLGRRKVRSTHRRMKTAEEKHSDVSRCIREERAVGSGAPNMEYSKGEDRSKDLLGKGGYADNEKEFGNPPMSGRVEDKSEPYYSDLDLQASAHPVCSP
jgi:hypothetical protein